MYVPKPFREDDPETLHAAMKDIGVAAIVGQGRDGLIATHAPIELDPDPAPLGRIRLHMARANPHADMMVDGEELLLIFQGPQGYITPSWYPSKQVSGKVVPTWNYVAVHAYGRARLFGDAASLKTHLATLTDRFERAYDLPWTLDDAPADFIDGMCRAIIGVEITLDRIEGKWKMSQNKSADDRQGVIDGLRTQEDGASQTVADLVEAGHASKGG